jgi:transposase
MEKVQAVQEVLRKLPVKEKEKSRAEVVEFLKADLRKAVKQGHSLKEIQAILAEQGVSVSLSRMEAVLGQAGENPARQKTGKQAKPESLSPMAQADHTGKGGRRALNEGGEHAEPERHHAPA